jgi:hypothetical protein
LTTPKQTAWRIRTTARRIRFPIWREADSYQQKNRSFQSRLGYDKMPATEPRQNGAVGKRAMVVAGSESHTA